jgi:cardiolipin synthase
MSAPFRREDDDVGISLIAADLAWLDIVINVIIIVVMLLYVPQKRTPAASRAWLLLIFFQPILGLILYIAFGRIYVSKRRLALQTKAAQIIDELRHRFHTDLNATPLALRPEALHVAQMARELGDFTVVGGNSFELLPDYDDSIARLIHDIDTAERSANLLYYIFADDEVGARVAHALEQAAQRGVTCRVLMDGLGSRRALKTLAPRMRAAGVEVHELLKPGGVLRRGIARFDLRNHRKIVVIDQRVGYIGSQNLVDKAFKKGLIYDELVARITGPALLQMQAVFFADRYLEIEQSPTPEAEPWLYEFPAVTGTSAAQMLPSGPGYHHGTTGRLLVALLYAASERVILTTPYFIPDEAVYQALLTTARRGVETHLVVSRAADQVLVSQAQRSYYGDLLQAGVHIHLYRPHFLHAKHMTFDDSVAIIGSSNIDVRSLELNAESSMLIYDPAVVADLRRREACYFAQSDELTAAHWSQRPIHHRLAQNIARLFDSFL